MPDMNYLRHLLGVLLAATLIAAVFGILIGWGNWKALSSIAFVAVVTLFAMSIGPNLSDVEISPTGFKAKLRQLTENFQEQKIKLDHQEEILNDLVIYSLAVQPYLILSAIKHGREYIYIDDDN